MFAIVCFTLDDFFNCYCGGGRRGGGGGAVLRETSCGFLCVTRTRRLLLFLNSMYDYFVLIATREHDVFRILFVAEPGPLFAVRTSPRCCICYRYFFPVSSMTESTPV